MVLSTSQAKKLAIFLRSRGINGGRVGRLVLGAPFQDGDGRLLWDAALAASGRTAREAVQVEDLYEILSDLGRPLPPVEYGSDTPVNLPE